MSLWRVIVGRCAVVLLSVSTLHVSLRADDVLPFDTGAIGVSQAIRRLETTGAVLHVVAHPDDEDGPFLTYCARGLGARTILFSITRGEGGANLISSDFFDRLGALRTLEHIKSASYYGNKLYYSRAVDYGYSKTIDEAQRQWNNGDEILADLVEVIRRERPTLIVSRFRGDVRDGHGHHQMAGVLSRKAFVAAADPTAYPEQIERGLIPWQAAKLYTNNIRPSWREEDRNAWTVSVPTGDFDPWMGRSYAQIARFGLGFQRSQGFGGHRSDGGPSDSYYRLANTSLDRYAPDREESMFAGVDTSLKGFAQACRREIPPTLIDQLGAIDTTIGEARSRFRPDNTSLLLPVFVAGVRQTQQVLKSLDDLELASDSESWLRAEIHAKQRQFEQAITATLGLEIVVVASAVADNGEQRSDQAGELRNVIPDQEFAVLARVVQRADTEVRVNAIRWLTPNDWSVDAPDIKPTQMIANSVQEFRATVRVGAAAEPTRPAWHRESVRQPFYDRDSAGVLPQPVPASAMSAAIELEVAGASLALTRPVEVRYRDAVYGDTQSSLVVLPAVGVDFSLSHGIFPTTSEQLLLDVAVTSATTREQSGTVELEMPDGWHSEPELGRWTLDRDGAVQTQQFIVRRTQPSHGAADAVATTEPIVLRAVAKSDGRSYREGFVTVTGRDLDRMVWFRPAVHRTHLTDVRVLGNPRVGYIAGSGDEVAQSLAWLGVDVAQISDNDLAGGDLGVFPVIMVGVRAYAVREALRRNNGRLMEYVKQGGVLIVQYQTPEFDHNFGPYPYEMGRSPEEVSEEDAKVTILDPTHRVWNVPNKITDQDFDGWVEQRGSKFLAQWDDHYVPLLECHDTGQAEQRGGMLIAEFGDGMYVYAAYAWYRQLPFGVPGAYRIMANLLSLPDGR